MISTSSSGTARSALTQALTGGFSGSTHAFQTSFIAEKFAMSVIQRFACKSLDLSVPAWLK